MDERLIKLPRKLIRLNEGRRDPFEIAMLLNYTVLDIRAKKQKGMCRNICNNYFIWVNRNMSGQMQTMTCAHEVGHCILHKPLLADHRTLVEMEIFDIKDTTEYEANLFAANLLIDYEAMMDYLQSGCDIVSVARMLNVNVNMLALKLIETQDEQLKARLPFIPNRKFMGTITDRADSIG